MQNHHRGKGPKNYTHSSDRIKENISDRLSDAYDIDATEIEVSVEGNEVTLSGAVNAKQQKCRAEDIAESVSGVTHVQNNLRVQQNQQNRNNDWNNGGTASNSGSAQAGTPNAGTSGSSSGITGNTLRDTAGTSTPGTGTSGTLSNQIKIEKSSAS